MLDPAIAQMMITGLINTLTAYMTYKVGMKQAEAQQPAPPPPATVQQGEAALAVVERGITASGTPEAQTALTGFKQNPEMFKGLLLQVLTDLVQRDAAFAQEVQALVGKGEPAPTAPLTQTATGSGIAQATHGSNASVTMHQPKE